MHVRRDAYCRGNQDHILDNILPFERRHHEGLPRLAREKNQRAESRDHMDKKKWYDDTFQAFYQKEDANETFEYSKQYEKCTEAHKWNRIFKKPLHDTARRRKPNDF